MRCEMCPFRRGAGEVVALCGENGAGKSTLMKILAGAIVEYEGEILLDGRPVRFSGTTRRPRTPAIRIIYQELNLVPQLSVADNIFLGREKTWGGRLGWLDNRAMERETERLFDRLGAAVHPRAKVGDLRIGDQQMVEIARALAFDAEIVIMDEPTSALADSEVARLFRVIADLRKAGATVLYISHKMNEIFELADQVVVLRDGQFVASCPRGRHLARPGRPLDGRPGDRGARLRRSTRSGKQAVLEVENLSLPSPPGSGRPNLRDITLFSASSARCWESPGSWAPGEPSCWKRSSAPVRSMPTGTIRLEGQARAVHSSRPGDQGRDRDDDRRPQDARPFRRMTVAENITLRRLPELTIGPLVDPRAEKRAVDSLGQGAGDQDGRRRRSGHHAFRWQPAEVHPRPMAPDRAQGSCCSMSRLAASTSGRRQRSTS